jgi:hypothetical protein
LLERLNVVKIKPKALARCAFSPDVDWMQFIVLNETTNLFRRDVKFVCNLRRRQEPGARQPGRDPVSMGMAT